MSIRLSYTFTQPISKGYSKIRTSVVFTQAVVEAYSKIRLNDMMAQPLLEGYSKIRLNNIMLQTLHPVTPERPMSTEIFPGFGNSTTNPTVPEAKDPFNTPLPGLTFSVHKKPFFKTNIKEAANGNEIRGSLMPMPRWDFEFTYEFIDDGPSAQSSLKTIMGFFLARGGSYDSFLVKDPDDYLVVDGNIGIGDGTTPDFSFVRTMGAFAETVGQVDHNNQVIAYLEMTETVVVPVGNTPTVHTVDYAANYYQDLGVPGYTKVTGTPAALQYSLVDGVYTFGPHPTPNSPNAVITYKAMIPPTDLSIILPNTLEFHTSPPLNAKITASFQFFFACRFLDDQMDFEKFSDNLWGLQTCNFRSIIQ